MYCENTTAILLLDTAPKLCTITSTQFSTISYLPIYFHLPTYKVLKIITKQVIFKKYQYLLQILQNIKKNIFYVSLYFFFIMCQQIRFMKSHLETLENALLGSFNQDLLYWPLIFFTGLITKVRAFAFLNFLNSSVILSFFEII